MKKLFSFIFLGAILFALTLNFTSCAPKVDPNQSDTDTINGPMPLDTVQPDTLTVDTLAFN